MKPLIRSLMLLAALLGSVAQAGPREDFLAAERAAQRGDLAEARRLTARLGDYPLRPYAEYALLSKDLTAADAPDVRQFLAGYPDTPLAPRLRRRWLHTLGMEGAWPALLADYRPGLGTETDCWWRQALLAQGRRSEALAGVAELWLTPRSLTSNCDPVLEAWAQAGGRSGALVWQRFEAALGAGESALARYLTRFMDARAATEARLWLALDAEPDTVLTADLGALPAAAAGRLALHALTRWAGRDSLATAEALTTLRRRHVLPGAGLAVLERRLALYLAARGHASAPARLTALASEQVDTAVHEWRVRVRLATGDWAAALDALDALPPDLEQDSQWRYWRARALEQTGRAGQARELYAALAGKRDYHGFLAADRIGAGYAMGERGAAHDRGRIDALAARPGLRRARELLALDREREARAEWALALPRDAVDAHEWTAAARLAHGWGWHSQAVIALGRAGHWDDLELRFPLPWQDIVATETRAQAIDPAWAYAVMRQESLFQPDARSGAGAVGLMQLLPATAAQVARKTGQPVPSAQALTNPAINVRLGSAFLGQLAERYGGSAALASAAYNAGPGKVDEWLSTRPRLPMDLWIETLPYVETRDYVRRVLEYASVYDARLGRLGPRVSHRLGQLPAR